MITASRLELAERCPGHLTVEHVNESNEYSEAGNERHAADEDAINSGDVPEVYADRWPGLAWQAEVSYAYDVSTDTARCLGVGLKRNYGALGPFEIAGTIDVEGRAPGVLVVADRKSFEEVTPAASNPQVRFLALAAARTTPADQIHVAINHELSGLDVAELDPVFDLDVIAHDIRQLLARSAAVRDAARSGQDVPFNTGRWCRWCPAFAACPKQRDLQALALRSDDDPAVAKMTSFIDDEEAPDVYELWKRIGILHKRIGQRLYSFAAGRPFRLHSGKMFGPVQKLGNEKLDGDVVYSVVKELHGQGTADRAVIRQATKKRLDEVLKGKRGAAAAVIKEVRERGGSERKTTTDIEEYDPVPRLVEQNQQSIEDK